MIQRKKSLVLMMAGWLAVSLSAESTEIDALLHQIQQYETGQSREALVEFEGFLQAESMLSKPLETRLIELLPKASMAGRDFLLQQLSLYGSNACVEAVTPYLKVQESRHAALQTLIRLMDDSPKAAAVLKEDLKHAPKADVLYALSEKNLLTFEEASVCLQSKDRDTAAAAAAALGRMGTEEAIALIQKIRTKDRLPKSILDQALLNAADRLGQRGRKETACQLYQWLQREGNSWPVRAAALRGEIKNIEKPFVLIEWCLRTGQPQLQKTAIRGIPCLPKATDISELHGHFPHLSDVVKVQYVAALAERGTILDRPFLIQCVQEKNVRVRVEAVKALLVSGRTVDFALLARLASQSQGEAQEAARAVLSRMGGEAVDEAILKGIPKSDEGVQIELIRAAAERAVYPGMALLLSLGRHENRKVRQAAYRAMDIFADKANPDSLMDLLANSQSNRDRKKIQTVLVKAIRLRSSAETDIQLLVQRLKAGDSALRVSLLTILGGLGHKSGLPVLRQALDDSDMDCRMTAILAFSKWPDAAPASDLLHIAETTEDKGHQIAALRGYLALLGRAEQLDDASLLSGYQKAMVLAKQPSEKQTVLSGVSGMKSLAALSYVMTFLDSDLHQEAEVAAARIGWELDETHHEAVKKAFARIAAQTEDAVLKNRLLNFLNH